MTLLDKLQPYICLFAILYLLALLVHDICVYHRIQAEHIVISEKESQSRQDLSQKLDCLIQLYDEEHQSEKSKERLKKLKESSRSAGSAT